MLLEAPQSVEPLYLLVLELLNLVRPLHSLEAEEEE
jgi:hypothetical protein